MRRRYLCVAIVGVLAAVGVLTTGLAASAARSSSQANAKRSVMRPLGFKPVQPGKPARPTRTNNLKYGGGVGGIGVETAPKVYLVLWGSQWTGNDPSGEQSILTSFFGKVGGSTWLRSVTQYCQGVASGTVTCGGVGGRTPVNPFSSARRSGRTTPRRRPRTRPSPSSPARRSGRPPTSATRRAARTPPRST